MGVLQSALDSMTTGHPADRDPNAGAPKDANGCSELEIGAPRMNYGSPSISTVADSFKWGIRWLIAKNSIYDYNAPPCSGKVSNMRFQGWETALDQYGTGSPYGNNVLKLYNEGKNPHAGNPTYLWPIKADGCPRI